MELKKQTSYTSFFRKKGSEKLFFLFSTCLLFILASPAFAQISGVVYQDFNGNGSRENSGTYSEPGFNGISVTGYGADGTTYGPVSTGADGTYTLPGVNQATRIEFTWSESWLFPSVSGGTSVRFVSGSASNIDLGVLDPTDYCNTTNPPVAITCFINGEATGTGDAIVSFDWNETGQSPTVNYDGNHGQVGSVWGTAYDRGSQILYSAAFLKRHVGLANDLGAIYETDYSGGTPGTTNATPVISISNAGTITGRGLGGVSNNTPSRDAPSFTEVGKVGLGGLEITPDGSTLYVVNLNTKEIVPVDLTGGTPTEQTGISIPDPGCSGNANDWRPFALKYHRGSLFVGGVCSGENGGSGTMRYYVYEYNLGTSTWSGALIDESLNYTKGFAFKSECESWNPWITTWAQIAYVEGDHDMCHPQPILSDIEFDTDGDMIMLFMDRMGHQAGSQNYCTAGCTDSELYTAVIGGDILRADFSGGNYTIESGGMIGGDGCGTGGLNDGQPGVPEYYCGDYYDQMGSFAARHFETMQGSGAILKGTGNIKTTAIDPFDVNSGGLINLDNLDGEQEDRIELYSTGTITGPTFSKANGLGEIDLLCLAAPVEIGNLVWNDTDSDGVQDPGEAGIAGVVIDLLNSGGTTIASATTDGSGNYIFSSGTGTSTASNRYGLSLSLGANYTLRIADAQGGSQQAALNTLEVTAVNNDATSNGDIRDSDGTVADDSDIAFTLGSYGENNHTYDWGFRSVSAPPSGTCDCQEYVFVNERDAGTIHKFLVNGNGNLTEVNPGGPWYPGAGGTSELPSPHGLGSDLNGFLYVAENWNDPTADIRRLRCDGTIIPESLFQLNAQAFNITSIGNTLIYNQPGGGTGPGFAPDWTSIEGYDICGGTSVGQACFLDDMGGTVSTRWGFWQAYDGSLWAYSIDGGDFIYKFALSDIGSGSCVSPFLSGTAGTFFDQNRDQVRGITTDLDENIYFVTAQSFGGPARVRKFSNTGTFLAETAIDSDPMDGGWYGMVGLVYVESCDCLYSANYTTTDDCVTRFSKDLTTTAAAVGPTGGGTAGNTGPIGGKAIGRKYECCPTMTPTIINQNYCYADVAGQEIFLSDILNCGNGRVICEGSWAETSGDANIDFNDCNLTITASAPGGCAQYTMTSAPQGANSRCSPFTITVDVCFTEPAVTANPIVGTCAGTSPNSDASISLTGVTGDEANYSLGATYSGPAYGAGGNINVSGGTGSFTGLMHTTQYTVRVFNGSNTCFTDRTVTTPDAGCAVPTYSLGNRVFYDDDISGDQNGGEAGIDGIMLQLLNSNGTVYDSDPSMAGIQALTVTTGNGGYYRFDDLPAGDYIVEVMAAAFSGGGTLETYSSSNGPAEESSPNNNGDLNDNGIDTPVSGAIRSGIVSLGGTEPTGEAEPGSYAAGSTTGTAAADTESNLTVDFGFYRQRDRPDCCDGDRPPCTVEPCHFISNDIYFGTSVTNDATSNPSAGADTDADDGLMWGDNVNAAPGGSLNLPIEIYNVTGSDAYFRMWIDWNGDGDFEDGGEQVADELYLTAVYSGTFTVYHQVNIPANAVSNQDLALRMRLSTDDTNTADPCGNGNCANDGEIEDYLLRVTCPTNTCILPGITLIRN